MILLHSTMALDSRIGSVSARRIRCQDLLSLPAIALANGILIPMCRRRLGDIRPKLAAE
jgi:hypothetical protein